MRRAGGVSALIRTTIARAARPRRAFYLLVVIAAALAIPLFAHGCHGDDVDHEPLLVPVRWNDSH